MMPGDEQITIIVDDAEVEATMAKIEEALGKKDEVKTVKDEAAEAEDSGRSVIGLKDDVRGTSLLVRRTVAQLPGVREAYHLISLMRIMIRVSPEIALILAAWMAGRSFVDWLTAGAREAEEYKKLIKEGKGFATMAQVEAFIKPDSKSEAYRGVPPP